MPQTFIVITDHTLRINSLEWIDWEQIRVSINKAFGNTLYPNGWPCPLWLDSDFMAKLDKAGWRLVEGPSPWGDNQNQKSFRFVRT